MSEMQVLPLPLVHPVWEHKHSKYPETIRVSFSNGKTVLYRIVVEQPRPVFRDPLDEFSKTCGKEECK